jgi:hypothetical protein
MLFLHELAAHMCRFFPLCLGSKMQQMLHPKSFITLPALMRKIGRKRAEIFKVSYFV